MGQSQALRCQLRARQLQARLRGFLGGGVLRHLLRRQRAARSDRLRALGIDARLGLRGLGFGHRGTRLRDFGLHRFGREHREHLAALDRVAHLGTYFCEAQAVDLGTKNGFLPGGHRAVGSQAQRYLARLRLHQRDRKRGFDARLGRCS